VSGLANGKNQAEGGRNGLGGKKKFHSTKVRLNFLVAWRHGTSFIMAQREKVRHPALFLFPLASSPTHMRKKRQIQLPLV
jgi:hypothetical protein